MKYSLLFFLFFTINSFADSKSDWNPRIFNCEKIMFEFTLDYFSDPSEKELKKLCRCIDKNVSIKSKRKNINTKLGKSKFTDKDYKVLQEFSEAIQTCASDKNFYIKK